MSRSQRIVVGFVTAVLAVVLPVSAVLAGTAAGQALQLGFKNTVDAMTQLIATTGQAALKVQNLGTGPGINIVVGDGKAPITVSAGAGKATNLDADKLDGKDASAFQPKVTNMAQFVNVPCSADGLSKTFLNGPRGLLDCASPDTEPNDNLGTALTFTGTPPYGFAGGTDVDFWTIPYYQLEPNDEQVKVTLYSSDLAMDLYINGTQTLTNETVINYRDDSHGVVNQAVYQIRIHGGKHQTAYGISVP